MRIWGGLQSGQVASLNSKAPLFAATPCACMFVCEVYFFDLVPEEVTLFLGVLPLGFAFFAASAFSLAILC